MRKHLQKRSRRWGLPATRERCSWCRRAGMATSSSAGGSGAAGGAPGLKTYFKTPEGRHKLQYEKTHSPSVLHYNHGAGGKTVSEV